MASTPTQHRKTLAAFATQLVKPEEKGVLMSTLDTRHQTHQQRLGVGSKTDLHWGPEQCLEAPEVSGVAGPLRSRVLRRAG